MSTLVSLLKNSRAQSDEKVTGNCQTSPRRIGQSRESLTTHDRYSALLFCQVMHVIVDETDVNT